MIARTALWLTLTAGMLTPMAAVFGAGRPEPRPAPPMRRALAELNLSPAQRRQLIRLRRERQQEQIQIGPRLRSRRRELASLYRSYPLDEAKAKALIQEIADLEARRLRAQLQNQVDLRRILTREQFARFTEIMEPRPSPVTAPPGRALGP